MDFGMASGVRWGRAAESGLTTRGTGWEWRIRTGSYPAAIRQLRWRRGRPGRAGAMGPMAGEIPSAKPMAETAERMVAGVLGVAHRLTAAAVFGGTRRLTAAGAL